MKKTKFMQIVMMALFPLLFISCKKDDKNPAAPDLNSKGVFIVNEGTFGSGNGSLSYLNLSNNKMDENIFEDVNGFPLGEVVQSMTIHNGTGYILVNGSQKIEVVRMNVFSSLATINGFQGPRYMLAAGNTGYVSDWFSNSIVVFDLATNAIKNSIPVGEGPEQMIMSGNKLFVVNVGGWNNDSTISVIDIGTESVIATINTGLNPNSLKIDKNGKLWVLCGGSIGPDYTGGTADDVAGSLWKYDPFSFDMELSLMMNTDQHPSKLMMDADGRTLYYLTGIDGYTGKVSKMEVNSTVLPSLNIINKEFYGLGIDPLNGEIYGGYSPGFSQNGYIFRYSATYNKIDSFPVGVAPNGFCFY